MGERQPGTSFQPPAVPEKDGEKEKVNDPHIADDALSELDLPGLHFSGAPKILSSVRTG